MKKKRLVILVCLMVAYETSVAEQAHYEDLVKRINDGEDLKGAADKYSNILTDYSTLHLGVGGYGKIRHEAEVMVDFCGYQIAICPLAHKLLEGRKLVLDRDRMKLVVDPFPTPEFLREIEQG